MKKIVSLLLCLALLIGMTGAVAEDEVTYTTLYSGEVTSLNYLTTGTTNEFSVAANIIDTLVERDAYGNIVPCLAETWEQSEDGLTWTFHIRKGSTWVDQTGAYYADVTAYDFVTAAQYVLDAKNDASNAWILTDYLEGAEAYYESTEIPGEGEAAPEPVDFDTVGVKALDDYTIAYTTMEPIPFFLSMLDYSCYMPVNAKFLEEKGDEFGLATGLNEGDAFAESDDIFGRVERKIGNEIIGCDIHAACSVDLLVVVTALFAGRDCKGCYSRCNDK